MHYWLNHGDFGFRFFEAVGSRTSGKGAKEENSLKGECFCPKEGDANSCCAWEELRWKPAAGRHEGERKEGTEKAVCILNPTGGG